MLCAQLERLESEFDQILEALEDPTLTEQQREALKDVYAQMIHTIKDHQQFGHDGNPCFEE